MGAGDQGQDLLLNKKAKTRHKVGGSHYCMFNFQKHCCYDDRARCSLPNARRTLGQYLSKNWPNGTRQKITKKWPKSTSAEIKKRYICPRCFGKSLVSDKRKAFLAMGKRQAKRWVKTEKLNHKTGRYKRIKPKRM